jgi:hypothetical protein
VGGREGGRESQGCGARERSLAVIIDAVITLHGRE